MKRFVLSLVLGLLFLSTPAYAGSNLRLDVSPEPAPCGTVRVMDGDTVVWSRLLVDDDGVCGGAGVKARGYSGLFVWVVTDVDGTRCWWVGHEFVCADDPTNEWFFVNGSGGSPTPELPRYSRWFNVNGRVITTITTGKDRLVEVTPSGVKVIKRFSGDIGNLKVKAGVIRFKTFTDTSVRYWVSDGTREGTHVVKKGK